jgi:protein-L-isoaspartate(D-aspartate) O-methyltransferase
VERPIDTGGSGAGAMGSGGATEFRGARLRLVEALQEKGIRDLSVLRAFEMTPRHAFVPTGIRHRAYEDAPLPIGSGQTISQPYVHARYLELLKLTGHERVLEVGTGSGYQTVLLAHLVEQVFSIERIPALFTQAREAIQRAGVRNVSLLLGDGTVGWREYAPYDAILVGAGAPSMPQPLVEQLAEGGRLLVPIGDRDEQRLFMAVRKAGETEVHEVAPVMRFVPLVGTHGWNPNATNRVGGGAGGGGAGSGA